MSCKIEKASTTYLFSCKGKFEILIDNCSFEDSNNFLTIFATSENRNQSNKFTLKNCNIKNCNNLFVSSDVKGNFLIADSKIKNDFLTEKTIDELRNGTTEIDEDGDSIFSANNKLIDEIKKSKSAKSVFDISGDSNLYFLKTSFQGVANCCVTECCVKECDFKNCFNCVSLEAKGVSGIVGGLFGKSSVSSSNMVVKKSNFKNCYQPLNKEIASINECQFSDCINISIKLSKEMQLCKISNFTFLPENMASPNLGGFCITLRENSKIENCVFENINLLRKPYLFFPYPGITSSAYITNCVFKNITTDAKHGKFFEIDTVRDKPVNKAAIATGLLNPLAGFMVGALTDKKETYRAILISNCQGLEYN